MALEIDTFFGHGYSCAESILLVALRFLKLDVRLVWTAAAFGGGLGQKDLCGFLTGGMMALGFAAGKLPVEKREAKKLLAGVRDDYWNWWRSKYPLRCGEIVTCDADREKCRLMAPCVACKLEELIRRLLSAV